MLDAAIASQRVRPARPGGSPAPAAEARPTDPDALAASVVDALVVAWTTYRVYADPQPQEAFRRALAHLATLPFPFTVEVHASGFRFQGRPLPTRREATPLLARLAFGRGIATLTFAAAPAGTDLIRLFKVVSQEVSEDGPPASEALARAGVSALAVVEHGRLSEMPEGLEQTEAEALAAAEEEEAPPEEDGGDPAGRYVGEYRLLYDHLKAGDFPGLQQLVHGFSDSFFILPRDQQTRLFEQFLTRQEEEPFRLLLDQFSDSELAELARVLSPESHPLLLDYARIAASQGGQSGSALQSLTADERVGDRIARILQPENAALRRRVCEDLQAQAPGAEGNLRAAIRAAESLLALSDDAGFARLTRMLAGKVAAALSNEDLARAGSWAQVLLDRSSGPAQQAVVQQEMEAALRSDTVRHLVDALAGCAQGAPPPIVNLVALFAVGPMLELLAREANQGRRRILTGLLAAVARVRPSPLLQRLGDPRVYLVHNLVEVLGRAGRPDIAPGLRAACSNPDHRVRREALRSLAALDRKEATEAALLALGDAHPAVRLQALALLKSDPSTGVDAALATFLARHPSPEEQVAAVATLAARTTEEAHALLRRTARPFRSRVARQARVAARQALARGRR